MSTNVMTVKLDGRPGSTGGRCTRGLPHEGLARWRPER
jgi:hypothetical protein